MISVNKELLQKYYRGECTGEESAAIGRWMTETDGTMELTSEMKMMEIEARIWKNIEPESNNPRFLNFRFTNIFSYGIAASLLFALGFAWFTFSENTSPVEPVVYQLNSNEQKTVEVSGLNFTLASNSNAVVSTSFRGKQGDISFCGAVQITNNSGADIEYVFESACKKSAYTRKQITFQSGETYIAVHNFYKTDEVIVMKKESLVEFPDAISSDLISEFSI
jgi:hypothetical protein